MNRFDKFLYGFLIGLLLPVAFMWIYLAASFPDYAGFGNTLKMIFPSVILGKLLLLSVFPDLILCFTFYKFDRFRVAMGFMCGGFPYLIASFFML